MKRFLNFKWLSISALFLGTLGVAAALAADWWVVQKAQDRLYDQVEQVPARKVGLVLGTSKYVTTGRENLYYRYRIEAAIKLYKAGKVQYLLLSGDNGQVSYNEPNTMKADLMKAGIPEEKIYLDYAGFRTLDSMVRCREVFQEDEIITISQKFHNERAVCIGLKKGVDAIGYNAHDVSNAYGFKTRVREKLARAKMVVDLWLNVQPKFGGPKITIGQDLS